jgi:hypothetical protein
LTHAHHLLARYRFLRLVCSDKEAKMCRTAACHHVETMLHEPLTMLNHRQRRALARWVTGALLAESANRPSVVQAVALLDCWTAGLLGCW